MRARLSFIKRQGARESKRSGDKQCDVYFHDRIRHLLTYALFRCIHIGMTRDHERKGHEIMKISWLGLTRGLALVATLVVMALAIACGPI
jgi:hypothetical protein